MSHWSPPTDASEAKQEASEAKQKASEAEQKASEAEHKASAAEQEASEAKSKVVHNMKIKGIPVEDICEITGLSRNEVEAA